MEKCFKHFHDFLASFSDCDAAPCCQLAVSTIGGHQALSRQPRCHHFHTHQLPNLHLCPPTPHSALRSSTRLRLRVEPPMASGVSRNPWENEHKCARIPLSSTCCPSQQCDLAAGFHLTWPKSCARLGVNFKTYRSERSRSWWKAIPEVAFCSFVLLTGSSS